MNFPDDVRYTKEHEWIRKEDEFAILGITDYAQDELGDIVFLELPKVGEEIIKDEAFGTVESVKTTTDLFAPASGKVVEVNDPLFDTPEVINEDPYGDGWFIKIEMSDPEELGSLMNAGEYKEFVEEIIE